ncbi:MAG TPA: hypothetical protein VI039_04710 [Solirubrobacterales bacterium]
MSQRSNNRRELPAAARVFGDLQADDALAPGGVSAVRKTGAIFLAFLVLGVTPLFLAAYATGVIGDPPAALAKGSNSGPGGGDDDDSSGPGSGSSGDDDDDTGTHTRTGRAQAEGVEGTDDTSRNGHSTRGTTNDNDTNTRLGTDDTSRNGADTRGTTNDNDTNTNTGTHTRTGGGDSEGTGQTRTRTGS